MQLFVNARFLTQPLSGVQRYGIECIRQIRDLNPETVFLAPGNILYPELASFIDVKVLGRTRGHLWEQTTLPSFLAENGNPPLLCLGNTAPVRYKNCFLTIHDLAFRQHSGWNSYFFNQWYNWLVPKLAANARHLFTVSETVRSELIKEFSLLPEKISVTYNGLSQAFLNQPSLPKEKIILAVGSFNPRKNHHLLLQAFFSSGLQHEYRLCLVGSRNRIFQDPQLQQYADEPALQIEEHLSDDLLADLYARAEMLISLSEYEGFGIPVLEGIYMGCKVLCSDIPVYRELYNDFVYFCNHKSINNICDSLLMMAAISPDPARPCLLPDRRFDYAYAARHILEQIAAKT